MPTDWPALAETGLGSTFQASIERTRAVLLDGEKTRVSPTRNTPVSIRPATIRRSSNL